MINTQYACVFIFLVAILANVARFMQSYSVRAEEEKTYPAAAAFYSSQPRTLLSQRIGRTSKNTAAERLQST